MHKCPIKVALVISIVMFFSSCVDTKKATYFNNLEETALVPRREDTLSTIIQKNDILNITISSLNAEASAIFNMPSNTPSSSNITTSGNATLGTGYLVNSEGYVQLPILGNIK